VRRSTIVIRSQVVGGESAHVQVFG